MVPRAIQQISFTKSHEKNGRTIVYAFSLGKVKIKLYYIFHKALGFRNRCIIDAGIRKSII